MKLKIIYIIFIITIITAFKSYSQDYERAFGIKFGNDPGVFYRKFSDYKNCIEAKTTFERGGFQLTLLREFYNPVLLDITDQFFVFFGFGAEIGYTIYSLEGYKFNGETFKKHQPEAGIGICGVLGIEYHLLKYPAAISLDYQPEFQFYFPHSIYKNKFNISLSISYTF